MVPKPQTFSLLKIIVNREEMEESLNELRIKTPEEIKRYQKIISNKGSNSGRCPGKRQMRSLRRRRSRRTSWSASIQIMQLSICAEPNEVVMIATKQAQEILDNATNDANNIRMGAMQYTDDILRNLENTISHSMDAAKARHDAYVKFPAGIPGCSDGEPCRAQSDCRGAETKTTDAQASQADGPKVEISSDMLADRRTVSQMKDL